MSRMRYVYIMVRMCVISGKKKERVRCENLGDWVGNLRCWECSVGNAKDWKMWPKKMVWARGDWLVSKRLLPCQHFTCNFFIIKINPKIKLFITF